MFIFFFSNLDSSIPCSICTLHQLNFKSIRIENILRGVRGGPNACRNSWLRSDHHKKTYKKTSHTKATLTSTDKVYSSLAGKFDPTWKHTQTIFDSNRWMQLSKLHVHFIPVRGSSGIKCMLFCNMNFKASIEGRVWFVVWVKWNGFWAFHLRRSPRLRRRDCIRF